MKINIDYKRDKNSQDKATNQELTADYINFAVRSFYKEGLDSQWRRTFARIQRKLDEAIDTKADEVDFEQAELDFIQRAVKEAKYPPELSKYVVIFEDELDKIK
jgi:hypothetical protein